MTSSIEAILFDMGGTLRRTNPPDDQVRLQTVDRIRELIGSDVAPEDFASLLSSRARAYAEWANQTQTELDETGFWTRWMLPDWPAEKISKLSMELNQTWRKVHGTWTVLPEARPVIIELFRRGYRLGLVSNTTSSVEVPRLFREWEVSGCFETVILSCVLGRRKPDPEMLLEAVRRMGVKPGNCAYIGDQPHRDVISARQAGFAQTIILKDPAKPRSYSDDPRLLPDHFIESLNELFNLFPAPKSSRAFFHGRGNGRTSGQDAAVYNASLSSMWAEKNFPSLGDFIDAAGRYGFAGVELNHKLNSKDLADIDLKKIPITSVHEPCPADISNESLIERGWLISAHQEQDRRKGVEAVKRSLDLAHSLSVPIVVIHCGNVTSDRTLENRMRALFTEGRTRTPEYEELKITNLDERKKLAEPRLEAVKRSLLELLEHAGPDGPCLGLENRYHYMEFPGLEELEALLNLAAPGRIGFVYDVGHAQAMDRLGFYPWEGWLQRYATRILEVHLHDVIGLSDHWAPGMGEVDFGLIAHYLPPTALRICELQLANSPQQVKDGLKLLHRQGCIERG